MILQETSARPQDLLQRFGLASFRPGQQPVIEAVLAGRDALCVMPTGGGKSLCYQLPALALPGPTLVVSPLIALMKDQEDQLRRLGIRATALHSGIEQAEQGRRLAGIARSEFDLVYLAPERLRSRRFLETIATIGVARLAVDEAHCISEWGHDFRPDYSRLGWFRQQLGQPPTIALTATATDIVRRDIVSQLGLREPAIFVTGFDRPNLWYGVSQTRGQEQKYRRLAEILRTTPGSIIIYAASRKACEEVGSFLVSTGRRGVVYHAGLDSASRHRAQDDFMSGRAEVVVATNAFGMGVDKPDVRAVIHFTMPGTMEAYYQEAGRAGRDGKPARCELLFSFADKHIQSFFIDNEHPEPAQIHALMDLLRSQPEELVQWTRAEMAERLGRKMNELAIGAALKVLEAAGAVERLRSKDNLAILRLHELGPDLTDCLPAQAKTQRAVLRWITGFVGDRRGQDCPLAPDKAAEALGMGRTELMRAIADISRRIALEYIPPFRGSATRVLDRQTPTKSLPIDFSLIEERKRAEYAKLEQVIAYAMSVTCRRAQLLSYFGDQATTCGHCDQCDARARPLGAKHASVTTRPTVPCDPARLAALIRDILSAVRELNGRLGKTTVALALTGSKSTKATRFGLQKRACFGRCAGLGQAEIVEVMDAMLSLGWLEQGGERLRPTVALSRLGAEVLAGRGNIPPDFPVPPAIGARLSSEESASNKAARTVRSG